MPMPMPMPMPMNPPAALTRPEPSNPEPGQPWWRFRIMWLVLGLPATVVCSSLLTAAIAWTHIDPVVSEPVPVQPASANALEPAQRARNHAATPGR